MRSFRRACQLALGVLEQQSHHLAGSDGEGNSEEGMQKLLRRCAVTSLQSKLVAGEKDFFADLVVRAVSHLDRATLDLNMIGVKKVLLGLTSWS